MPRKNAAPRALSLRQAQACENALHTRCRCRCGGTLHGAKRAGDALPDRKWFAALAETDPHRLPSEEELSARRAAGSKHRRREKIKRDLSKLETSAQKWRDWHGENNPLSPWLNRRLTKLRAELATL